MNKLVLALIVVAFYCHFVAAATDVAETQCWPSGHTRLWAQQAAGVDLAQAFLAKKGIPRVTKIGVVDSGFDSHLAAKLSPGLTLVPVTPEAEKDSTDVVGHGTIVLSLIKGANGLGGSVNSPTTLYAEGLGRLNNNTIANTALRACREGANVISISLGTDSDIASYIAIPQSATFGEDVVKELGQRGCILVHSAGNEAAPRRLQSDDFEFEIGATDPLGKLAQFSSAGEFQMPGERVTGLMSTGEQITPGTIRCNQGPEALSSGTSFSTPLFASHMALLRDVLITSKVFMAMSYSQQLQLARDITNASLVGKIVNSYVAARLAYAWLVNPNAGVTAAKNRVNGECQKPSTDSRAHALLCDDTDARLRLAELDERAGDLEGAAYWFNTIKNPGGAFPTLRMKMDFARNSSLSLVARWTNYFKFRNSTDQEAKGLLIQAATTTLSDFPQIIPQLKSPDFSREFQDLSLFVIGEGSDVQLLNRMMVDLRADSPSQITLVSVFLKGYLNKIIPDTYVKRLLDSLTAPNHSDLDIHSAISILKYVGIDFQTKLFYLNKILGANDLPPNTFEELSLMGIDDNSPSDLEIEHWLQTMKTMLNSPRCDANCADKLAIAVFANDDIMARANRTEVEEMFTKLDGLLPPESKGHAIVQWVRGKLPKSN